MQSERWARLKQQLIERGWTCSDETLYAPHETMWFAGTQDEPDLENLRRRMTMAAAEVCEEAAHSTAHAELYGDVTSLIAALDEVLDDDPAYASYEPQDALLN